MLSSKIVVFFLIALTFCSACSSVETRTKQETVQTNKSTDEIKNNTDLVFTEPVERTGINDKNRKLSPNIEKVWKKFVENGQYRLAQPSDMTFSDTAKLKLPGQGKTPVIPYAYAWGKLNYPMRVEDDHLAVIVVDTTKNDSEKFSLVIFSPVENSEDKYEINWLYRNKDLSKTDIHGASGDLHISQYLDDGSRKACSVIWNKSLKKFVCDLQLVL
jgi:hypothetical protein